MTTKEKNRLTWEKTLLKEAYEEAKNFSMKPINKFYHYTTIASLAKIIENNTLLLTHCQFLNDSAEFLTGRDKIIALLNVVTTEEKKTEEKTTEEKKTKKTPSNKFISQIESIIKGDKTLVKSDFHSLEYCFPNAFSTSFCMEDDLRYQWQTYAGESGISIEFDFTNYDFLLEVKEENGKGKQFVLLEGLMPLSVLYDEKKIKKRLKFAVNKIESANRKDMSNSCESLIAIFFLASFIKNKEFYVEKEHRIVLRDETFTIVHEDLSVKNYCAEISYTLSEGVLKPRMTLAWQKNQQNKHMTIDYPIKAITVGPGRNQDFVYKSICHFLDYGNHSIKIIHIMGKDFKKDKYEKFYRSRCGIIVRKSKSSYIFPRG